MIVLGFGNAGISQINACSGAISGTITDADNGEPMSYVTIFVQETGSGTISDDEGHYLIEHLCDSTYTLVCSHIGCDHIVEKVSVKGRTAKDFSLSHAATELDKIVVHAESASPKTLLPSQQITGAKLAAAQTQTLGDALKILPGVSTFTTGSSIVKPVIRGMHSNRLVILNNGVRQEGNQWGAEHAPEIDPFLAEKLTVVKGAAGVQYGAEAIGGVILVEPPALPDQSGIHGTLNLAGFSNGGLGAVSGRLEGKWSDKIPLSGRIQGTLRKGGNLKTPDYYLDNTGLEEYHFSWAAGWTQERWQIEAFYSQFNGRLSIFSGSHIGNLTDLQNAIEAERPNVASDFSYDLKRPLQHIEHELAKIDAFLKIGKAEKLKIQLARQFNRRQEFDSHGPIGASPEDLAKPGMQFELTTYTFDAALEHKSFRHLSGTFGLQGLWQQNSTDRGGLIPNYETATAGIFLIEKWKNYPSRWEAEAGLRYDWKTLSVSESKSIAAQTLHFNNLSGSLGLGYTLPQSWKMSLVLSTAWRAPNVNELFSDGIHHGAAAYEKGDPALETEKAVQSNFSIEKSGDGSLQLHFSVFQQWVGDFIYLQPRKEFVLTIRGAFPAFDYLQTDALLFGGEADVDWNFWKNLHWQNRVSLLRAKDADTKTFLPFMPADRIETALQYDFKTAGSWKNPFVKMEFQHTFRQSRIPENSDFAPPPPAYSLLNLEAGIGKDFSKNYLDFGLRIQNLLNVAYRDYMDRLRYFSDEPGRNISLRIKWTF